MRQIEIQNADTSTNKITVFETIVNSETPVIIIFPAMGVRASFYEPLANALAAQGYIAVTADLRGHGNSNIRPNKKVDFGYKDQLDQDYTHTVQVVKTIYPSNPIHLLGHSLGGQLACLYAARHPEQVQGLVLIACCSVYYKGWVGIQRPAIYLSTQFMRGLANLLGYFPGKKVGFGGLEAKSVMRDWSQQARTGKYILANDTFDYEDGLNQLDIPVLAISFASDNFAPKKAVQHLLGKFKNKNRIHHVDLPKDLKFSHFNWVKKHEKVVELIKEKI